MQGNKIYQEKYLKFIEKRTKSETYSLRFYFLELKLQYWQFKWNVSDCFYNISDFYVTNCKVTFALAYTL